MQTEEDRNSVKLDLSALMKITLIYFPSLLDIIAFHLKLFKGMSD